MTTPLLTDLIEAHVGDALGEVNTCLPGRVEYYDSSTGRATVQPLVKRGFRSEEEGVREVERRPTITEVPVIFPGSGGVRIKFPIVVGDAVLLVFSSASLEKWLEFGAELDPEDDRKFHLTDAIAIPGLLNRSDGGPPTGGAQIEFTLAGQIHAGGSDSLALNSDLNDLRSKIRAATNGDAVPGAVPATPYGGTSTLKGG